ncbi:antitoxin [Enterococcus innesii]
MNYEQTVKIESLNELSKGVTARLIAYLSRENIPIDSPNDFYALLYQQFKEMLNLNLFQLSSEELENIEKYWQLMNELLPEIGVTKK